MNIFNLLILSAMLILAGANNRKSIENSSSSSSVRKVELEKKLIDKLLGPYDKRMRPADTVNVKFSLYLNQIITLIEQEQVVVLNAFLDHEWRDNRLEWNPNEYAGISLIRINSEFLWMYVYSYLYTE